MKPGFPVVIEFTGSHGLEPSAEEGRDYHTYAFIADPLKLPLNFPFKIIATNVRGDE